MYIHDIVKARTLPSQFLAKQRQRREPLRVGTDVFKMAESRTADGGPRGVYFAGSKEIAGKFGAGGEMNANATPPSYTIDKKDFSLTLGYEKDEETGRMVLMGRINDGSGKKIDPFEVTEDMRISRGADGAYTINKGRDALTSGKLVGSGEDILVRVSGADVKVEGGNVSVVNFGQGGSFDGGNAHMTYVGDYYRAKFVGGDGGNAFGDKYEGDDVRQRSSFTGCTIDAGGSDNTYDGYFAGSVINGGEGNDIFRGIFTDNNVLNGNGGNDSFIGYFKNSELNGGDGINTFAYQQKTPGDLERSFMDASTQFVGVTIDGGEESEMNGVFTDGTTIVLNKGEHAINGVFQNATVNNIDSQDTKITAFYAGNTSFIGESGSTKLLVHSASHVGVALGEGDNAVTMGAQPDMTIYNFLGGVVDLSKVRFYRTESEYSMLGVYGGVGHGTLAGVETDVTKGTTILDINTGFERSVNYYGPKSSQIEETEKDKSSGQNQETIVLVNADGKNGSEKAVLQGPKGKEAQTGKEPQEAQESRESQESQGTGRPEWLHVPQSSYAYRGEKKRRSLEIIPDSGLAEAVRVKTQFGISRYHQERNERLGYNKEYSLFTSLYDWQV